MRKVEVVPYDPSWMTKFEDEASKLERLFEGEIITIHHIGSTAVPGLDAKPIIDIMPVVWDIEQVDDRIGQMEVLGYRSFGENGIPGRRFFAKGDDVRTVHIHLFEDGDENVLRHLAFRDYLTTYPHIRDEYATLKRQLASQYPDDIDSYVQGKQDWVERIERMATMWYKSRE